MLFSSYVFIFLFLPLTLAGFALVSGQGRSVSMLWLLAASSVFYAYWNPIHLPLFCLSAVTNFTLGKLLRTDATPWKRNTALAGGVAFNLGLIAYYKYSGFLAQTLANLTGTSFSIGHLILPLGISFFTFQQIGYLVDCWRHQVRSYTLLEYGFFVMFFPHLIAGPLVQHHDLLDQHRDEPKLRLRSPDLAVGLVLFIIGLAKKVLIADSIQPYVATIFGTAESGIPLAPIQAWVGVLAYTLQLYFDFSGYSDMAIGLARMFSFQLPLNFNSPYKATSIIDFWRRWHMTLSVFLRDYLYIPLGGSRCHPLRRYSNLLVTMTLGGLWHGAGWTFILWGAFHGVCLCLNHAWVAVKKRLGWGDFGLLGRSCSWAITFLAVVVGWTLFRSSNLAAAKLLLTSLGSGHLSGATPIRHATSILAGLLALLGATVLLPNSQQWLGRFQPALDWDRVHGTSTGVPGWMEWYAWKPQLWRGIVMSGLFVAAIATLTRVKEFLYFQF